MWRHPPTWGKKPRSREDRRKHWLFFQATRAVRAAAKGDGNYWQAHWSFGNVSDCVGVYVYPRGVSEDWTRQLSGHALARDCDKLHKLIKKGGCRDLMSFYVPHKEEMSGRDKEEWFNPMEGVGIMDAMERALEDNKDKFEAHERLKEDLRDLRAILERAASMKRRWNLALEA
jgi:hypothetical protein